MGTVLIPDSLMKEIHTLVDNSYNDLENISFRGFPVGKIAQYDFILETKYIYTSQATIPNKDLYAVYIKNTALAIAIADRICEQYKPSLFLTFHEYAECQAVRYSAEKHNVARMAVTYPVHYNIDGSRFAIWKST